VRVLLSECNRERYIEQHVGAAINPKCCIFSDVLFISKPCSVLRSLMCEFHMSANRIIFKVEITQLALSI